MPKTWLIVLAALTAGCATTVPQAAIVPSEASQSDRELFQTTDWTSPSRLLAPSGVAFARDGSMWVADSLQYFRFDPSGQRTVVAGTRENIEVPTGIAVNREGEAYVIDTQKFKILKVSPDGKVLKKWGKYGTGDGQLYRPKDVAVDDDGYVYVTDSVNHRVQKFEPDGKFVSKWHVQFAGGIAFVPGLGVTIAAKSSLLSFGLDGRNIANVPVPTQNKRSSRHDWVAAMPDGHGRPSGLVLVPGASDLIALNPRNGRVAAHIATGLDLNRAHQLTVHKEQAYVPFLEEGLIRRFPLGTAFHVVPLPGALAAPRGIAYDRSSGVYVVGFDQKAVLHAKPEGGAAFAPVADFPAGSPTGLAMRADGTLLVLEPAGRRVHLMRAGKPSGSAVTLAGAIAPLDLADDGAGGFVVADAGESRLLRFDAKGRQVGLIGGGLNEPSFFMPSGVARDREGHYWVADTGNQRVVHAVPQGGYYHFEEWSGQFDSPTDVVVDDERGSVYVVDRGNHRIIEFDREGNVKGVLGSRDSGLVRPYAAALGPRGSLFVSDGGNNRVVKIERGYAGVPQMVPLTPGPLMPEGSRLDRPSETP